MALNRGRNTPGFSIRVSWTEPDNTALSKATSPKMSTALRGSMPVPSEKIRSLVLLLPDAGDRIEHKKGAIGNEVTCGSTKQNGDGVRESV